MPLKLPSQDVSPSSQLYQRTVKVFSIWRQLKTTMIKDMTFISFFCQSLFFTCIGLFPQSFPFISLIALTPSSGSEKATNPYPTEPLYILFSTTRALVNEG